MRFQQGHHSISSLGVETAPQSSSVFGGFPETLLNSPTAYQSDGSNFYSPNSHIFSSLEHRARQSAQDTTSTGMAQVHRSAALPHPTYSTRELYSRSIPSYPGRPFDPAVRSSSNAALLRRHPLTPTPSPSAGFTPPVVRMETTQLSNRDHMNVPPLLTTYMDGKLFYADPANTPIEIQIHGQIDKGFFYSEGDWTCYRRNYFACGCSYSYSPTLPSTIQFTPDGSSQTYTVLGFAMSIAAVVAEAESQQIDLVQHTPKRDKGPTSRPDKIRLDPKPAHQIGHYGNDPHARIYETGFIHNARNATDHTFERIQFKQATANNGKRRAAQQYYHLVIELYAEVGNQSPERFVKIAHRNSAKVIVRGRSPGHYQQDRRGSTGSGGGGASGMGGHGSNQGIARDYDLGPGNFGGGGYDPRSSGQYPNGGHHELSRDATILEEPRILAELKEYCYPPSGYDGGNNHSQHDAELYGHRNDHAEQIITPRQSIVSDAPGSKPEYDGRSATPYNSSGVYYSANCQRFDSRSTPTGYYPTVSS